MTYNFNSQILYQLPPELETAQRAIYYGDGLFETIRMFDGQLPFLRQHLDRLFGGLNALGMLIPPSWTPDFFEREIRKLTSRSARIRLSVWRLPGGLYFPEHNDPVFLISSASLPEASFTWRQEGVRLGICETVRLPVDSFSSFKTLNAPRYVAAAREARGKGWDDGLLLNAFDRIAEATSSNLFWKESAEWYTPPLSEGCVAGTMRAHVAQLIRATGATLLEKPLLPDHLVRAQEIFLTNAIQGIVPVRIFAGNTPGSESSRTLFEKLIHSVSG
ncbi:MAG: aminotransferase class IV [Saprospiraceae bacterium]|nr:aminotransferase class IV [Saprospiraceae bacterium]